MTCSLFYVYRVDGGEQSRGPGRREEGAYRKRYVTDEQRGRPPIFIATHWAAAGWLFFGVARSSRINLDMLVVRALKNSQLIRQLPGCAFRICETVH